jgi:hypothetical protein
VRLDADLSAVRTIKHWLGSWNGVGLIAAGMVRRPRLARDVLHHRDGALAHELDRDSVRADGVGGGAARGVKAVAKPPSFLLSHGSY